MAGQRVDDAQARSVLADLPFLRYDDFSVEPLAGGLTNRNFRVRTVSGKDYVARFAGATSGLLAIDRDAEAFNSRVAADLGVGPGVVEYDAEHHVLVVDWIDGRTFTDADVDDAGVLTSIARTCRALHTGPRFRGDFDMFEVQRHYLAVVQERGLRLPADYLDFEPQVRILDDLLHRSGDATVACHNDLLAANMMSDGREIRFVDFEYSGNNDACFELGNIWSEAGLADDRLEHLVTSYYGAPSPGRTARARLFGLISKYGWTLWASIQDAVSEVDFDFWHWGMEKYTRAVAEFRSPLFDDLVRTVHATTTP